MSPVTPASPASCRRLTTLPATPTRAHGVTAHTGAEPEQRLLTPTCSSPGVRCWNSRQSDLKRS